MLRRSCLLLLVALMFLSFPAVSGAGGGNILELITAEEAASPELPPSALHIEAALSEDGPTVDVLTPKNGKPYKPPVEISIRFIPKEGRDIDLSTLRVEYLKFITIDLTKRVRPYVSKKGIEIPETSLPSGTHTIRLTIGDVSGSMTRRIFYVKVL
ncbi:MAG: hypothetical protein ACE5DW_07035 [Thermodesulfobacteriota bacterium]